MIMTDRHNIYELFEEIHMEAFANQSVGEMLKELNALIGPFDKLSDGELVTRLSGYKKSPYHVQ